jgi:uncharacterized glyoxalase superfamily protein PhnB
MPHSLSKLTPNLIVTNVEHSMAFYRDVLGFTVQQTVPDAAPFVFAIVAHGNVEVFFNTREAAVAEYPAFADSPIGGTLTMFVEVSDIEAAWNELRERVDVVMPYEKKWYGMTEFAFRDPDGYLITYAARTA